MKLCEITIPKKPEPSEEDVYVYQRRLRHELKMKKVGQGAFADVFQHPKYNTIVVKVSTQSERSGALAYLQYAAQHQDNPHVPKLYGIRRFQSPNQGLKYFIAFIEKLASYEKLSSKQRYKITRKYFGPTIDKLHKEWEDEGNEYDGDWGALLERRIFVKLVQQSKATGVPNKHLMEVMAFLFRATKQGYTGDLWHNNMMMRGDVPVITDPLV